MDISLPVTYALAVLNSAISGILTEYYISKKNLYYIWCYILQYIFDI